MHWQALQTNTEIPKEDFLQWGLSTDYQYNLIKYYITLIKHLYPGPRVAEGSNLKFRYRFMVRLPFKVKYFEIMRNFCMGKIIVYMDHTLVLRRLVCCILTIQGNSKFIMLIPYGNSPSRCIWGNSGIFWKLDDHDGIYIIHTWRKNLESKIINMILARD